MEGIYVVIILILFWGSVSIALGYSNKGYKRIYSSIDNRYYFVKESESFTEMKEKANTLAFINKNIELLISELDENKEFSENISLLKKRYSPENLFENIYPDDKNTTFTVNKGDQIVVCLDKEYNELMFVMIHELSHVGCVDYGHNKEFKDFFSFLLKKAVSVGIYNYKNYSENPVEYCGIIINTTPI